MIKILDCTLRDGGYVNNWEFKQNNIIKIITNLIAAKIDYIECGFFKFSQPNLDKSIFTDIHELSNILIKLDKKINYTLMINYGEYDINTIPICDNKNISFRIAFKKEQCKDALDYCRKLKNKGYNIFINPMHTNIYSNIEILEMLKTINDISPKTFTIVDTTGTMKEKDVLSLFYLINNNLNDNISLGFHSHNNLQLSFSNAQCLMKICDNRELIIDSTVFGMGRGAGNLCTELIIQYVNDNYNGKYNIIPILKIIDEQINPIFLKTPWGYSVPYYLAAINHCHPNYAKYLVDKQTVPVEIINELLGKIPNNKKINYDSVFIKQLYLDMFSNVVKDEDVLGIFKSLLRNKEILVLAPGKSLDLEKNKIYNFINKVKPYVISLNFIPNNYDIDLLFITNMKRFNNIYNFNVPIMVTSNIKNIPINAMVLNYSSYLNNSKMFDNVALMLFTVLIKLKIKKINVAGLDGFSTIAADNYVTNDMINNSKLNEFDERNEVMSKEIIKISKKMAINFITKSKYI